MSTFPSCPHCGGSRFREGGGNFGTLTQRSATCLGCNAYTVSIHMGGNGVAAYFQDSELETNGYGEKVTPKAFHDWANTVLLPTWRSHQEQIKDHEHREWKKFLADNFYTKFPELKEVEGEGAYRKFSDTTISYRDCPPEAQKLVDAWFGDSNLPRKQGSFLPIPEDVNAAVYPPQIPNYRMKYLGGKLFASDGTRSRDRTWKEVDPAVSAAIEPPEDPILRRNRELFDEVFSALEKKVEQPITREKTSNGYGGVEPWFTFQLGDSTFTVGWRKRVIAIHLETESGIPTEDIRTAASADKVTYQAFGPKHVLTLDEFETLLREEESISGDLAEEYIVEQLGYFRDNYPKGKIIRKGGWQDDRETAFKLEVHAWGKDKLIEYLTILGRTALLVTS